jgi:serine/threonine protein kinase
MNSSQRFLFLFLFNLQILKRCCHPNIISLYGYNFYVRQNKHYLVFEYASCGSLEKCLICEKSFQVIEPAINVRPLREWVVKIAPNLHFGLFLFQTAANSPGLSFPFPF